METDGGQLYVAGTARGNVELDGGGGSHSLSDIDFLDVFIAARTSSLGHQDVWFFGNDESTESLAGVDSIGEDLVFAGTTDGTVGAANLGGSDAYVSRMGTDGSLLWTAQMGTSGTDVGTALVHAYGVVYVAGRIESRGVVWALDAQDGTVLWESIIGAEDNNSDIGGIRMDGVDLLISGNSNRDLLSNLDVAENTGSPAFFAWINEDFATYIQLSEDQALFEALAQPVLLCLNAAGVFFVPQSAAQMVFGQVLWTQVDEVLHLGLPGLAYGPERSVDHDVGHECRTPHPSARRRPSRSGAAPEFSRLGAGRTHEHSSA